MHSWLRQVVQKHRGLVTGTKLREMSTTMTTTSSRKPFTILVEGNIGSGKSTFLNNYRHNESIATVYEPVDQWRNLRGHDMMAMFYRDKKAWAFSFQTYILLTMTRAHELKTDKPIKMMERSIYSGRHVFIENLANMNILSKPEVSVLDELYQWVVSKKTASVDLIVYLRTDPEVAYQRMLDRGRANENLNLDYMVKLHHLYENWLMSETGQAYCPAPVMCINANKDIENIRNEFNCSEHMMKI